MDICCRTSRNRCARSRENSFNDIVRSAAQQRKNKDLCLTDYPVRVLYYTTALDTFESTPTR